MKKYISILVLSVSILFANTSMLMAKGTPDPYGHVPVDTGFVLDSYTVSALIALVLFGIGALLIVAGKYFKSLSN
ncbi:MAG: hypothetical protein PHP96_01090 [Candidatus Dojkabacteria bacterium]|jgi:hypothetical protein|nr:hypothetical protein [Candidatus Dojkabacteria bacterium]MDD4560902.1 hypothetical protein [Candidatus Dojkabacteria bacterium]NLB12148.1 hypothetical protein [Candidatus Dojkabacteria bacterium]